MMFDDPLSWVAWLVGLMLSLISVVRVRDLLDVPALPASAQPEGGGKSRPRVSVIITARDEEARIETSVRRMLAQPGIEVEIIVVDDRSTDRTSAILSALAREDSRVRVHRIDVLPDEWLGKPHACHAGAGLASGEWLLFSDADAWVTDRVIARAIDAGVAADADHVCLIPSEPDASLPARATLINFSAGLVNYAAKANRDGPRSMIGVGAFNLVRGKAYRAIGGHEPLRLEVVDDLKLGLLLRRAGFRSRAYGSAGDVEVHWSPTVRQLIVALEKNMFAMLDFSAVRAVIALGGLSLLVGVALAAPFVGGAAGLAALAGWLTTLIPSLMMARRARWGLLAALLTPLMTPVMIFVVANSAWVTLRQRGIRWRGTFYPLEMLRRGRVAP
jgi:cellulose synthase/poly-beta-1,6-N-acetylglucosamine synthase-like glycosyltransferase